jgi:hypothetical protein
MASGRRVKLGLPADSGIDEVERARVELARLDGERTKTWEERKTLVAEREQARQADLDAAAKAIRAAKPEPRTRKVDAVDAKLTKLDRYAEALERAFDGVEGELIAAVEERRPHRLQELDEQLADAQAAWREQIDAAAALLVQINTLASLREWFRTFPGPFPQFHLRSFGSGNPAGALAALRACFDEREASGKPHVMPRPDDGPTPLRNRSAA